MNYRKNLAFKSYEQHLGSLLPVYLEDHIAPDSPARLVSEIVDNVDISELVNKYLGGGTSSYHPRMLLKVIIYAYLENITSSRKIARMIRKDIEFMWLA